MKGEKCCLVVWLFCCFVVCMAQKKPTNTATVPTAFTVGYQQKRGKAGLSHKGTRHRFTNTHIRISGISHLNREMILNRTLSSMFLQGTVFQTAFPFVHPSPRLCPGLLSLRSVQASSLITSKREERQGAHPKGKRHKSTNTHIRQSGRQQLNTE